MRKSLIALGAVLLAAATVLAQSIPPWKLRWTDPNPSGFVREYKVYAFSNSVWNVIATVQTNSWTINLPPGLHTLSVGVVSTAGMEGPPSTNLVVANVIAVVNLRVEQ